jgi:hypothetical protein
MFGYFLHEKSPVLFLTKMDWATFWAIFYELIWPPCFLPFFLPPFSTQTKKLSRDGCLENLTTKYFRCDALLFIFLSDWVAVNQYKYNVA